MLQIRHAIFVAAGVCLSFTLAVAGCGQAGPATSPETTATAGADPTDDRGDAKAALAAAIDKSQEGSARVTFTMLSPSGSKTVTHVDFDPGTQRVSTDSWSEHTGETMYILLVEQDLYLRSNSGPLPHVWLHTDRAELPPGSSIHAMAEGDMIGAADLMRAVTAVEWTGDTEITGTVDLTRWSPALLPELGDAMLASPLKADLDKEGRLTHLSLGDSDLNPELPVLALQYRRFGQPVTILPPTDAVSMPDTMVAALGN
ncbi:hypothetical protein [Micromonospora sp. NBC_01813]|uniref:hypothetical protein n=1 Tax=Micromonospora sp. NBC_01813 TaxID=2975988 RepID=UPI002DDC740F|nr:hypothetical protein [Micromonospora sp. NBC_01813]WSA12193.1 hypothetical protein OG958_16245 [Micromonospora sp. NBC_01813]